MRLILRRRGSSPLARGLLAVHGGVEVKERIIPARAGFTCLRRSRRGSSRDHPRSRGVYLHHWEVISASLGSSPLARGLREPRSVLLRGFRIIPARAGFTWWRWWCYCRGQDHPRSRGVYVEPRTEKVRGTGSSPLARGLRDSQRTHISQIRIIPARAGFTLGSLA